ncbi:hypothetical protein Dda_4802 [Drechslerella dactyloides]|uniref:SIS domain-containing protein n=1 Tax=Drechslerella dactyloides TaxID=74499 RepID=A0AAD6NI95_DREDA|nr:hypothetical protein Dda_4802 [Drechslerella dactyloides]
MSAILADLPAGAFSTTCKQLQANPAQHAPCPLTIGTPPGTPPLASGPSNSESILDLAVHVLATEAASLNNLTRLYTINATARTSFVAAVQAIVRSLTAHGKVVFSGMGKSGKVAQKTVATMNSLGLMSFFLHPTEAMHGDVGIVRPQDTVVLVSYSGTTSELVRILEHMPSQTTVIAMTAHAAATTAARMAMTSDGERLAGGNVAGCPLTKGREGAILLPTPVHESEEATFGVSAPTTSTTVALALGDALALSAADTMHQLEGRRTQDVFHAFHPGGAIGGRKKTLADWAVDVANVPLAEGTAETTRVSECLMAAFQSKDGWVKLKDGSVVPPRRLKSAGNTKLDATVAVAGVAVAKASWIVLDGGMAVDAVRKVVKGGQVVLVQMPGGGMGFAESDDIL